MMCCITPLLQCSTLHHCCALLLHYCALLPLLSALPFPLLQVLPLLLLAAWSLPFAFWGMLDEWLLLLMVEGLSITWLLAGLIGLWFGWLQRHSTLVSGIACSLGGLLWLADHRRAC